MSNFSVSNKVIPPSLPSTSVPNTPTPLDATPVVEDIPQVVENKRSRRSAFVGENPLVNLTSIPNLEELANDDIDVELSENPSEIMKQFEPTLVDLSEEIMLEPFPEPVDIDDINQEELLSVIDNDLIVPSEIETIEELGGVELILDQDTSPTITSSVKSSNAEKKSPEFEQIIKKDVQLLHILLEAENEGVSPLFENKYGETPLTLAELADKIQTPEELLSLLQTDPQIQGALKDFDQLDDVIESTHELVVERAVKNSSEKMLEKLNSGEAYSLTDYISNPALQSDLLKFAKSDLSDNLLEFENRVISLLKKPQNISKDTLQALNSEFVVENSAKDIGVNKTQRDQFAKAIADDNMIAALDALKPIHDETLFTMKNDMFTRFKATNDFNERPLLDAINVIKKSLEPSNDVSLGLNDYIINPKLQSDFLNYAKSEFSDNEVEFLIKVNDLVSNPNGITLDALNTLYTDYIAEGAKQINLGAANGPKLAQALEKGELDVAMKFLGGVVGEAKLTSSDTFTRFVVKDLHHENVDKKIQAKFKSNLEKKFSSAINSKPTFAKSFSAFAKKEFSSENIDAIKALQTLEKAKEPVSIDSLKVFFQDYIFDSLYEKNTSKAKLDSSMIPKSTNTNINISGTTYAALREALQANNLGDAVMAMDDVINDVEKNLADTYSRYRFEPKFVDVDKKPSKWSLF
jgi:hypothetical protein